MALALCEAGGTVHALDLPTTPSQEFKDVQSYISQLPLPSSSSTPPRLFYHSANVTSQSSLENLVTQTIIPQSGRMDFVVAAAGILGPPSQTTCLTLKAEDWEKVFKVNTDGVFYTAQAGAKGILSGETKGKGKGKGGSIILIASMSGSITNRVSPFGSPSCDDSQLTSIFTIYPIDPNL
jgi:NAD(P)-dependent dehydrogenase (short-subunit alcohol dehydrogenase family)